MNEAIASGLRCISHLDLSRLTLHRLTRTAVSRIDEYPRSSLEPESITIEDWLRVQDAAADYAPVFTFHKVTTL